MIVATGNIANDDLLALFERHFETIVSAPEEVTFTELESGRLVVHGDQ